MATGQALAKDCRGDLGRQWQRVDVWWAVQAEVLAGQSRTPAVIPGAAPLGPRLGRGRRIFLYVVCWVPCTEKKPRAEKRLL